MSRSHQKDHESPIIWSAEQLGSDLLTSINVFRRERLQEPLEAYLEEFDKAMGVMENVLEASVDLTQLQNVAVDIICDQSLLEGLRYLTAPPISKDDLLTVIDAKSLAPKIIRADKDLVVRLLETVNTILDRRRFPWVSENREAMDHERRAAILASAALIAGQHLQTHRRIEGKNQQERAVMEQLSKAGLIPQKVKNTKVRTSQEWPDLGHYYAKEVSLIPRKADLLVRLWDGRLMPIECKVSNSSLNSVKRLNNDAAAKATVWITDLGRKQIVPVATLSGVYSRWSLEDAQDKGLMLIWSHRITDLTDWIERTRP